MSLRMTVMSTDLLSNSSISSIVLFCEYTHLRIMHANAAECLFKIQTEEYYNVNHHITDSKV